MQGELARLLRPAGGGIHTVTTGRAAQRALQRRLYGADDDAGVEAGWREALGRASRARVLVLGVPCDTGAGLVRGQNLGPQAIREAILAEAPAFFARQDVVDVGDVRVVPHLLHDEMVSDATLASVRRALYGDTGEHLPVSPLSIAEHALSRLLEANPRAAVVVLGGDHSVAWPALRAIARVAPPGAWGIVQPDAHTDLLPERLGVRMTFASWAYHANDLIGRGGRLVQVGIRASGSPRAHWEQTLGVRQFWADEVRALGEAAAIDAIVAHLRAVGVRAVYVSNDIDGTDPAEAPATAAAEPGGLSPAFVLALIRALGEAFAILGGDVVEVAPTLADADGSRRTCAIAASYVRAIVEAALRGSPR
ncbi:MAG: arginase family protein [Myxococcota bacterium]